MFILIKDLWHAICFKLLVAWRGVRMQVTGWFDRFHDRRAGLAHPMDVEVDIPGLGKLHLVRSVDCLGAMCPRPQLLTMKVLGEVEPGDAIEVLLDNPTAVEGFPALAQTLRCTHLVTIREPDHWRVYLRKNL